MSTPIKYFSCPRFEANFEINLRDKRNEVVAFDTIAKACVRTIAWNTESENKRVRFLRFVCFLEVIFMRHEHHQQRSEHLFVVSLFPHLRHGRPIENPVTRMVQINV